MRGSREMRVEGGGVALSWSCLRLPGIYSRGLNCKVLTFKGLALPVCEKEHLSARPPACLPCKVVEMEQQSPLYGSQR